MVFSKGVVVGAATSGAADAAEGADLVLEACEACETCEPVLLLCVVMMVSPYRYWSRDELGVAI